MIGERRWGQHDLTELLTLHPTGQQNWRSSTYDANANGRVYGGQLLGQTLWAAAQTLHERTPSMLHVTFLQGAHPKDTLEYSVEGLQDGRRLSTRHVYGVQGTGLVLSANVSFQVAQSRPEQLHALQQPIPAPENLPTLAELAERYPQGSDFVQLRFSARPVFDIRPVHPRDHLECPADRRDSTYWVRVNQPLAAEGCLHQAALAYLSDSWLSASLVPEQGAPDLWQNHDVSNLNHTLWFHSLEINVNEWLLFINDTVRSRPGRGLSLTHIYRRDGRLVASMAKDVLISPRDT